MKQLSLILIGVLLLGCQTTPQSNSPNNPDLQAASQQWDQFFNAANAEKLAGLYAEDALSMPPNLPTLTGRKAIEADFKTFFAENIAEHKTIVDSIIIENDFAIERGRYQMKFRPKIAAGTEVNETGRHLEVRRKINGQWKIILEIWNTDAPAK